MKLILINGAPKSGKDFAAHAIESWAKDKMSFVWEKFSKPHKVAFAAMMNKSVDTWGNVEHYEDHKDRIIPALGVSYRQWQIDFSEKFMKPLYGDEIFAKLFIARTELRRETPGYLCVVSDCGFQVELDVITRTWFNPDVLLIRIYREGYSFAGDSRQFVYAHKRSGVAQVEIINKGDGSFARHIIEAVEEFYNAKD